MNNLFPENSYMGKCSCGKEFITTKGVVHCHNCLYTKIAELEKTIKSLTDGVTHFHKSHGDMNPLLTAYIEALKEQGQ